VFSLILCFALTTQVAAEDPIAEYRKSAVEKWEKEIAKLEELDKSERDPAHAILYIGSSSIRRWESITKDMSPWPAIRRGYGGAKFSDLVVFVDRLVNPHQFDALVVFVGNDIVGKDTDKTPEEVLKLFQYVVERVRIEHPQQPIFLIGITPTSSRFDAWGKVQEMHEVMRKFIDSDETLHFVDTADAFLGEDGKPMDEFFVEDRLHLNAAGYELWARLIKAELERVLGRGALRRHLLNSSNSGSN
jgi:lysophospholipase L1-like esterase